MKWKKCFGTIAMISQLPSFLFYTISYADGNAPGAIEKTWKIALVQIRAVADRVVFPVIDLVSVVFFFGELETVYFDFWKHGQSEWNGPAILLICLVFILAAPTYMWQILGM